MSDWKNETCKSCTFRVQRECRLNPPGLYPGGNAPTDYYPLVGTNEDEADREYLGACAKFIKESQ